MWSNKGQLVSQHLENISRTALEKYQNILKEVDLFSYAIFEKYERRRDQWYKVINEKIKYSSVYLPDK
jgi:hypothetical protein